MKSVARSYVYWLKIDNSITDYVRTCYKCASVAKNPRKTTLDSWPVSNKPMQRIHIDVAELIKGEYYIVVIDSYSNWPEIIKSSSITSTKMIIIINEFFAKFGNPDVIVTDEVNLYLLSLKNF